MILRSLLGVGTKLTNELGPAPLNIMMKMVRCNGQPVAKVSDSPGKGMCDDPGYLAYWPTVAGVRVAGRKLTGPRGLGPARGSEGSRDRGP